MQEHPLLMIFAQIVGDFFYHRLPGAPLREALLRRIAQALVQGQSADSIREYFQFEKITHFSTQYLDAEDRDLLNHILGEEQTALVAGQSQQVRVFLREMPLRAAYLRSSIPAWARAAALMDSIGPILNRDGRRFWLDVYAPVTQVRSIGFVNTNRPVIILGPDKPLVVNGAQVGAISIGRGTIWVQARQFVANVDEKLYCPLLVESAEVSFQNGTAQNSHGQLVMRGAVRAVLSVRLRTQEVFHPEDVLHGTDAWNAQFRMPKGFDMQIQPATGNLTAVADAGWTLYGEEKAFSWAQMPPTYNYLFSAVSIPMTVNQTELNVLQASSPVFYPSGATKVDESDWLLPAAEIANLLPAEGAGMLSVRTQKGLLASTTGVLDANQANSAPLHINRCWITGMPGQIQVIALETTTEQTRQTLRMWMDKDARWNELHLQYPGIFPFIYQSNAAGTEAIISIANCSGKLDRPLGVDQQPFPLETKTSLYLRQFGALSDYLVLYDENVIRDNAAPVNGLEVGADQLTFQSRALALNNALLTVSPVNAFLLNAEMPPQADYFTEASLLYGFGLVGYMPILPDPYAANKGLFKWMHHELEGQDGVYRLSQIQRLLVGTMHWQSSVAPDTRFIFGDQVGNEANMFIHLNPLLDLQRALSEENNNRTNRAAKRSALFSQHSGLERGRNDNYWPEEYDINIRVNDQYRNHHFFSLLDVSTAADWMGVDLGYLDEAFIFEQRFSVETAQNPLSADGMDVVASGKLVRLFTTPQISWEPVLNTAPATSFANDPPEGLLLFKDDGPPALIGNTGNEPVPIAPLPLAQYLEQGYRDKDFKAWSFFTLPFGMLGIARYNQELTIGNNPPSEGARIDIIRESFGNDIATSLQISTQGYYSDFQKNRNFEGMTYQLYNLYNPLGQALDRSILSKTVTEIFNREFGPNSGKLRQRGVPVERYDFSGYGANLFSHWLNDRARIAETSQAKFDVWRGRTAHEVIQVRSILYPWGIRVVRTITMFRNSAGLVYRIDSGWRAESDGVYDFSTVVLDKSNMERAESPGYAFHSGIVKGVFNVRNIVESDDLAPFERKWTKTYGYYIDENDGLAVSVGAGWPLDVELQPVYFDADVEIEGIIQGGVNGRTPSKRMLGYLQLAPRGVPISAEMFRDLLLFQNGLGGPVDCVIDIADSKQHMRLSRVEIQPSMNGGQLVFVTAAKGTPILPKDGSWSVVMHKKASKEVLPISDSVVPLIRRGLHGTASNNPLELASPTDLFNLNLEDRATQYAFLQNTDTQKVLFRNPFFETGIKQLQSSKPDLADAYRLLNSKGIFPKLDNLPRLDLADFNLNIIDQGYQLLHKIDPAQVLDQVLPDGPVYFINEKEVKIYAEYAKKDIQGNKLGNGTVNFGLDSALGTWANKMNDITVVIDLLDMKRLFLIRGKFDTEKGKAPAFTGPELQFGKDLQPIVDILQVLQSIGDGNYGDALNKGLKIAMSNSPNNWEYKFQADKELPVLRFPPGAAGPAVPLRLEAYMKLGCYFNVGMPLPPGAGMPMPSGGAFIEFGAKLSVMCLSVAAATVYAVGTCNLRISADTVRGPGLSMKMGFGVELMVGLPVIGNVSVYYAAGVEISIDSRVIVVGAFILFRGRAELIGGLVTIQIQIEAAGKVVRDLAAGRTDCVAQVTFSLDISIFLVINISFSKSFQENRQIA